MGKKEKLIKRLKSKPRDFTFESVSNKTVNTSIRK